MLILFNSYMMLVYCFVTIVLNYGVTIANAIPLKAATFVYMLFNIYQINFFSKNTVSRYFNERDVALV